MASVTVEVIVDAAPQFVWNAIADVSMVHQRLLPGRVDNARIEGDLRILTMPNGAEIRELIIAIDEETRRMAYAVQSGQALPITYHHASFQVFETGETDRSRLVWITDVLPHPVAPHVQARVERGIVEMKDAIEAALAGTSA